MASRSKLILDLARKRKHDEFSNSTQFPHESKDSRTIENQVRTQSNRQRSESSSSSSSSSSRSTSSSSSTFQEDSDDSVKDPDYKNVQEMPKFNIFSQGELSSSFTIRADILQETGQNEEVTADINPNIQLADTNENIFLLNTMNEPKTMTENESLYAISENSPPVCDKNIVEMESLTPTKTGKKRPKLESNWKKNVAKKLKNSGKSYLSSKTKKEIAERKLKPPCEEACRFKCRFKISESQRQSILNDYWNLGNIERQWSFLLQSMEEVKPAHRYVRVDENGIPVQKRDRNNAFFFTLSSEKVRVCKTFFVNTLAINNRPIETALKKKNKETNICLLKDNRGRHSNHIHIDDALKNAARAFIEAIPKIESHYIRANSKKHYIDGSKSISDIHKDYVDECKKNSVGFVNYIMFYRIFTQDFNISFFIPKKDACEFCEAYKNSSAEEKELKQEVYLQHHEEKRLSRIEKEKDKNDDNIVVAVYDLQAVFQCPKGEISVFYYKSKLNVLNLTIYDLKSKQVESYVWDESQAHRGVNEIATCVFEYIKKIANGDKPVDVIFYSDNCAGQQKNKFMMAMYLFAVQKFPNIKSITHKFLIKGHTQNEGDSVHSQIERQVKRQLRSGPIYTPEGFIGAIKAARKNSMPIHVNEMCYSDIYDWKACTARMNFVLPKDEDKKIIKLSQIKMFKVQRDDPEALFYKMSYAEEYKRAVFMRKKGEFNLHLEKAFKKKPGLAERKKADIISLLNSKHIPGYYKVFFDSL